MFSTHLTLSFSWQGVYGLLGLTAGLVVVVGMVLKEAPSRSLGRKHVCFFATLSPNHILETSM